MEWVKTAERLPFEEGQARVIFYSTKWSCPIYGMVTIFNGEADWSEYNQQEDRYYCWDIGTPEYWTLVLAPGEELGWGLAKENHQ